MYPRDLPVLATATPLSLATPYLPQQNAQTGMSLTQLASILWAYRKQSLLIAASVILLAAIACALWPRTYEATATMMVDFEVNDPLAGREFPTNLFSNYMSTQVEMAQGLQVLLPVIERLKLTENKNYTAGYSGEADGLPNWVAARLLKKLVVKQGDYGSQLIYVTYSASKADEAAQVANAVAEVYSEQQHQRTTGPASDRALRYTEQLKELKNKVVAAQEEVTAFRQKTGLIDSDAKHDVDLQVLSTLEQRLLEAQNVRRAAEARASVDQAVGTQVLASPMIQTLKAQVALQNSQMAELRATLGPRHPQVLALQSQLSATRQSLNTELQTYSANAVAELGSARQLEQTLQKALEEQRLAVIRVRQLQDGGAKHQLELESAQSVYKRALDGYDQILFASSGGYTNINFVSRAIPPPKPSKPKVGILMFLAVLAGGALGLTVPLVYELLNRRVRCRDDMERDHGIPVLVELGPLGADAHLPALGAA